jgi:hypothetical protein
VPPAVAAPTGVQAPLAEIPLEEEEEIPVPEVKGNGEVDEAMPPAVRMRPWVAEGLGVSTSSSERRAVNRFSLGFDLDAGPDLQWTVGLLYELFTSGEVAPDVGDVHRSSTMIALGWFFVPHRAYLKLIGGAQAISGSTPEAEGASFAWTGGVIVGARSLLGSRTSVGLEASFQGTQSVSTEPLLNPSATGFRFPAQTLFTVSAVLGLDFGRLR